MRGAIRPTWYGYIAVLGLLLVQIDLSRAANLQLPRNQATPGGIVHLAIQPIGNAVPIARFNGSRVMTLQHHNQWLALIGVPLATKPGAHSLSVRWGETGPSAEYPFTVHDKSYETQYLTIKNKRKVNPNSEDLHRITHDTERIKKARHHWSDDSIATVFTLPVEGRESSQFGLRRFFNNQPRRPHGGLDIAAPEGTPVFAPAEGTVIETGNYFFSGNCVFVDHGAGLITFYAHMNKIDVVVGQVVDRNTKLGEVGETGRVTGQHLHWSLWLNRTWFVPKFFLFGK